PGSCLTNLLIQPRSRVQRCSFLIAVGSLLRRDDRASDMLGKACKEYQGNPSATNLRLVRHEPRREPERKRLSIFSSIPHRVKRKCTGYPSPSAQVRVSRTCFRPGSCLTNLLPPRFVSHEPASSAQVRVSRTCFLRPGSC